MCKLNIDINTTRMDVDKLDEFCNLFDLSNSLKPRHVALKIKNLR